MPSKPMIHELADVQSTNIGTGTRIWQFCVVLPEAKIGSDCNICSHCFVENDVKIGDRVTVKCGVQIWDGVTLEDDVFVGPNVTFTNDPYPRSNQRDVQFPLTLLKHRATVGANSTILPGITIGTGALVGAGSVVTKDVPDFGLVIGNPAKLTGWVCPCGQKLKLDDLSNVNCECGQKFTMEEQRLVAK